MVDAQLMYARVTRPLIARASRARPIQGSGYARPLESSVERSTSIRNVLPTVKSESRSDATSSEDEETTEVVTPSFKHPKGFKELRQVFWRH